MADVGTLKIGIDCSDVSKAIKSMRELELSINAVGAAIESLSGVATNDKFSVIVEDVIRVIRERSRDGENIIYKSVAF